MKQILSILAIMTINYFSLMAQNNIDLNSLPEVEDYSVIRSNPSADTIIIGLHGGPTDMLYEGDFEFFENISTFSVVEMQQYQHLNPGVLSNSSMTLEEAIIYNDTTVALLKKLVNHYNNLNKTVVLMGHSFGAFLLPEYLDDYGIDDIHRIIPMAGRLNMNQEVVDAFATGYFAGFINGTTVAVDQNQASSDNWAGMKLQAGVGYNRYIDSLGMMDLTKLMYVYGTVDEAVGALLPEETTMLENTNATIIAVQNGGHDSPFFNPQMIQILDFIRGDQMVGVIGNKKEEADVNFFPTIIESELNIDTEKKGVLKIVDLKGEIILQRNYSSGIHQMNMAELPRGFYVATYQTFDNEIVTQKLIVKQR